MSPLDKFSTFVEQRDLAAHRAVGLLQGMSLITIGEPQVRELTRVVAEYELADAALTEYKDSAEWQTYCASFGRGIPRREIA